MSSISERVAREHRPRLNESSPRLVNLCAAGCIGTFFESPQDVREHVAAVTEALVREQVAAEIRAPKCGASDPCELRDGECCDYCDGLDHAARIAEGVVEHPVPYDGRPDQAEIEEAADYAHYLAEGGER